MEKKSFEEILKMVSRACNATFYSGTRDVLKTVLECATQIYIAQMKGGEV
jgi:hypothetical protein